MSSPYPNTFPLSERRNLKSVMAESGMGEVLRATSPTTTRIRPGVTTRYPTDQLATFHTV